MSTAENETTAIERLSHEVTAALSRVPEVRIMDLNGRPQIVAGNPRDYDQFGLKSIVPMVMPGKVEGYQDPFARSYSLEKHTAPVTVHGAHPGMLPLEPALRNLVKKTFEALIANKINPVSTRPWFVADQAVLLVIPFTYEDYVMVLTVEPNPGSTDTAILGCYLGADYDKLP